MKADSRRVYSTEQGRLCPDCGAAQASCRCREQAAQRVLGDGRVRVSRETKGRKGKGVTLITGLPLAEAELKTLATRLKQRCGTGGAVKEGHIEIQGDHRDMLVSLLQEMGYAARKAGA